MLRVNHGTSAVLRNQSPGHSMTTAARLQWLRAFSTTPKKSRRIMSRSEIRECQERRQALERRQEYEMRQAKSKAKALARQTLHDGHSTHEGRNDAGKPTPQGFVNEGDSASLPSEEAQLSGFFTSSDHSHIPLATNQDPAGTWITLEERLQYEDAHTSKPTVPQTLPPLVNALKNISHPSQKSNGVNPRPPKPKPSAKPNSKPKLETPRSKSKSTHKSEQRTASDKDGLWETPHGFRNAASEVNQVRPAEIKNTPVETDAPLEIPRLQHNLDRVLFNPGVHVMRDERSRVYNFDPDIATIMPVDAFDYDALGEYITSSKDEKLRALCQKYEKKYCGSTSSLSSILSHFHYLISQWRPLNFKHLSQSTFPDSFNFTQILRAPAAAFAHFKDGSYAIDADKGYDVENVLSNLGRSMEKHLLLPKEEYDKYRLTRSHEIPEEQRNAGESYHYSELGDFLVRSQLDAVDPRLPGTGVFDVKTRAVVSIRMDVQGYEKGVGYEINKIRGQWSSFEREYMDMIRAAFLKYSLQVRMGRMDGIFCAFHNTQRLFGFQYIPLSEMDLAIHGTEDTRLGDEEFKASVKMLNDLLDKGTQRWPGRTLRLHVETRPTVTPVMYFFMQPVTEEEMSRVQSANRKSAMATAQKVVQNIKDLQQSLEKPDEAAVEQSSDAATAQNGAGHTADDYPDQEPEAEEVWNEMMSKVEDAVENDSNGIQAVREALGDALERQGLLNGKSEAEAETIIDGLVETLTGPSSDAEDTNPHAVSEQSRSAPAEGLSEIESDQAPRKDGLEDDGSIDAVRDDPQRQAMGTVESESGWGTPAAQDKLKSHEEEDEDTFAGIKPSSALRSELEATSSSNDTAEAREAQAGFDLSELSLRDLILRAAENADSKTGEMRAFERAVAELSAEARAKQKEAAPETMSRGEASNPGTRSAEQPSQGSDGKGEAFSPPEEELLGFVVSVQNKVNKKKVVRPEGDYGSWTIGYSTTELPAEKASTVYAQLQKRRRTTFNIDPNKRSAEWHTMFAGRLKSETKSGKLLRKQLEKEDRERQTVHVAWDSEPQPFKKA